MTPLGTTDTTSTDMLIARDVELARVNSWLRATITGGDALCIVGNAGAGKTAVLDVAAERAARAGLLVLRTVGTPSRELVSLAALDQLLAPVRERIAELPPEDTAALTAALGRREGPGPADLRVFAATLMVLRHLAGERPLAVLIDDVQWVDGASAAALNFVARRVAGSRIGVLMTLRSLAAERTERASIPTLDLSPLNDIAASRLVGARFPSLPARLAQRIVAAAAGSPLALVELPAMLTPAERSGLVHLRPNLPIGPRLTGMFADRIAALTAEARDALLLAALSSGPTTAHDLRSAEGYALSALDPKGRLHEAEEAGLVNVDRRHGRVAFSHPLARTAVIQMSSELECRHAHRKIAEVSAPGTLLQVWHRGQASLAPDEKLASDLEEAARVSVGRGGTRLAVHALSRAAELSDGSRGRRRRLAAAAYLAADVTGELGRARGLLDAAAFAPTDEEGPHAGPGPSRTQLSVATAEALVMLNRDGDIEGAYQVLVEAITLSAADAASETTDRASTDDSLGDALHTLMLVCCYGGSPDMWWQFDAALRRAGEGAPRILSLCADTSGDPVARAGSALPHLDAHLADLHLEVAPTQVVRSAMASFYVDRSAACREALSRVVADSTASGGLTSAIAAQIHLGFDAFASGDWCAAARLFDQSAAACGNDGYRLLAWPALFGQALLAAAQGQREVVETITASMIAWAEQGSARLVRVYAHHARALAALGAGDPATAFEHAVAINPPGQFAPSTPHALWIMLDTVESAVAIGRRDEASKHVAAMRASAVADLSPRYAMVTATAAALVARSAEAVTLFEDALAVRGGDRWLFDWARTQLLFGEHLRRQANLARAQRHLCIAADVFSSLGAEPWRHRAATQLRGAGRSVPAPQANQRTVQLNAHQVRVATLAATGLTNREIADRCGTSHRGVGSVLSRVFRELNVTSRAALGDALSNCKMDRPG